MNKEEVTVVELLPKIYHHINVAVSNAFMSALEQFKKGNAQKSSYADEDFLSAEEAASFLKLKLNTIYSKAEKGELPFYRSGKRKLLFSKKELEQHVLKRKVKSLEELKEEVEQFNGKKK
ncbi:MAG: Helix-turn-helix domain [Bacteroidota bacterium]|jgi:excisionase family DNA binding protein